VGGGSKASRSGAVAFIRARKAGETTDPMNVPTTTMENTMKRKRLSLDMASL
jgi:hypothetical protein